MNTTQFSRARAHAIKAFGAARTPAIARSSADFARSRLGLPDLAEALDARARVLECRAIGDTHWEEFHIARGCSFLRRALPVFTVEEGRQLLSATAA
jgi:hypothetical protein